MKERPDTPCVAICTTLFDEICQGCGRTAEEVIKWVTYTQDEKDEVWKRLINQGYPRKR